ncbi:SDR family NAD(P)-dependent oxidoreductase [Streptomyces sp. NPDC006172]|uniref:SDR family NAD(P)-dependent oxidoreductase n=1 Tax=Streptomyces sp. NPDC006172 TaxID=3154470 RepID=UPI0033E280D0
MNKIDYRTQTTLITGASAGLGAEFARQFAERGSNLVLVARRADRLQALADELSAKHRITVTVVPFDLAAPGAGEALAKEVARRGITVTSLVNNAGFGTHAPFRQEDAARVQQEIGLNVASLVDVTRALIGQLTGVLVNVASSLGYQPWPNAAVYGATKAFVLSLSRRCGRNREGPGCACSPSPRARPAPSSSTRPAPTTWPAVSGCRPRARWSPPHCARWTGATRRPASCPARSTG